MCQLVQCCLFLYLLCSLIFLALISVTSMPLLREKQQFHQKREGPRADTSVYTLVMCIYFSSTQLDLLPTGRVSSLTSRCVVLTQLIASVGSFKRLITYFVDIYSLKSMNTSNVMFVCCILLACLCYTYKYAAPLIVKEIYCVHILYN